MSADPVAEQPIRVLVVDDQALVRAGFQKILEIEPDLEVVGEAPVAMAPEVSPDVVLMDACRASTGSRRRVDWSVAGTTWAEGLGRHADDI